MSARPGLPSLGRRLLQHVLLPLALTWLVGTSVALVVAHLFAQRAFDRSLLDDAYLLASHVRVEEGRLQLNLTQREIGTVLFDQAETVFFNVRGPDGAEVGGHADLHMAPAAREAGWYFDDITFRGRSLRAVNLHRAAPLAFDVTVAQTVRARNQLLEQLLLFSLVPQLLLLAGLSLWLRRAIRSDVAPLGRLERAVADRDAQDLRPLAVQATTRDVDALAEAINSLLLRLQGSVRAQREFSGNVAHELRTPLAGIRALADYGLAQRDPAVWREQLQAIAASEARASRLVDTLLALALAHEAEAGLVLAPVALDELVRAAVLRFLPRADAAGVDLGARGIERPVQVEGDATLIDGILNNLLDNALRYGAHGGSEPPAVTVALEAGDAAVVLLVQDNGPGLPGEQQEHLLRRGVRGETAQLLGQGAGLGLALVAQYARLLDARMALGTGPGGRGWACTVTFPRRGSPPNPHNSSTAGQG